jgi:hypothetical protein
MGWQNYEKVAESQSVLIMKHRLISTPGRTVSSTASHMPRSHRSCEDCSSAPRASEVHCKPIARDQRQLSSSSACCWVVAVVRPPGSGTPSPAARDTLYLHDANIEQTDNSKRR